VLRRRIKYNDQTLRATVVPIDSWRAVQLDARSLRFKPTFATFLLRLKITLVMSIIVGGLYLAYGQVPWADTLAEREPIPIPENFEAMQADAEAGLREMLTEEEWAAFQQERAAEQAAREASNAEFRQRANLIGRTLQGIFIGGMCLAGGFGILAPMSCLWNSLNVWIDATGRMRVRIWGMLWPKSSAWPMSAFGGIRVVCDEDVRWVKNAGQDHRGYVWRIVLHRPDTIPVLEFQADRQKRKPSFERFPKKVKEIVQALHSMTRLPVDPVPEIRDAGAMQHGLFSRKMRMHSSRPPVHEQWLHVTVRDENGNEKEYTSLEEMPPEIREAFERARRSQR
jgi:hypothetical protein